MTSYGYQGAYAEELKELDLEYNEFFLRLYDPQTGRFIQADPFDQFPSPYIGMGDDPVNMIDPSGGFAGMGVGASIVAGAAGGALIGGAAALFTGNSEDAWKWALGGAVAGALVGLGSEIGSPEFLGWLKTIAPVVAKNITNQMENHKKSQSLHDALKKLRKKESELTEWDDKAKDDFLNHFGTTDEDAREEILDRVKKSQNIVREYLRKKTYKTKIRHEHVKDNVPVKSYDDVMYSWSNDKFHYVWYLSKWLTLSRRMRMGALVHEISHFEDIGNTEDLKYGESAAAALRDENPFSALMNADNFRLYIQGVRLRPFNNKLPELPKINIPIIQE